MADSDAGAPDFEPDLADGQEDLGPPIGQLLGHSLPVESGFRARVGRGIERRILAADATRFGVLGPITALLELLRALFEGLGFVGHETAEEAPADEPSNDSAEEDR